MQWWVYLLLGLALVALVWWVIKQRQSERTNGSNRAPEQGSWPSYSPSPAFSEPSVAEHLGGDLTKMEIGGYIRIGILRNTIKGIVHFTQDEYDWWEYYLDDGSWLSVEVEAGEAEVIMWEKVVPSDLTPNKKQPLLHNGVTYLFDERGVANYTTTGVTDLLQRGVVDYFDYATDDGANCLSIEYYDGAEDGEVSIGEAYQASMVEYYPPG